MFWASPLLHGIQLSNQSSKKIEAFYLLFYPLCNHAKGSGSMLYLRLVFNGRMFASIPLALKNNLVLK
jgi:hypothetical protein